jgi:hypothetical protein
VDKNGVTTISGFFGDFKDWRGHFTIGRGDDFEKTAFLPEDFAGFSGNIFVMENARLGSVKVRGQNSREKEDFRAKHFDGTLTASARTAEGSCSTGPTILEQNKRLGVLIFCDESVKVQGGGTTSRWRAHLDHRVLVRNGRRTIISHHWPNFGGLWRDTITAGATRLAERKPRQRWQRA